jgi:hypothetical protein
MTKAKATKLIEEVRGRKWRLRADDIQYIIELAGEHPRWSVQRIFNEALRPKIRTCLMLPLTPKMKEALDKAAKTYQISVGDVCYHILQEWLKARKMY